MSEFLLPLRLQTVFAVSTAESHANSSIQSLDQAIDAVCKMKKKISDLERIKALYVIHLRSYQNDYDVMKGLYRDLKHRLDILDQTSPDLFVQPQQKQVQDAQQTSVQRLPGNEAQPSQAAGFVTAEQLAQSEIKSITITYTVSSSKLPSNAILNKLSYKLTNILCSVRYDSTGTKLAIATGKYLFIINSNSGAVEIIADIPITPDKAEVYSKILRWSPNGEFIVVSCNKDELAIFSARSGSLLGLLQGHANQLTGLAFYSDSIRLLSGDYDGTMCLWNLSTMSLVRKISHGTPDAVDGSSKDNAIASIVMGCGDSFVAVAFTNGVVGIYDPDLEHPINPFPAHKTYIIGMTASKTQPLIVTTSHDQTAKVWLIRGIASLQKTLVGHSSFVITAEFSNDNKIIFTGSKDEEIRGWDCSTGECLFQLKAHSNTIFDISHSPTASEFASCSGDGVLCVWKYSF